MLGEANLAIKDKTLLSAWSDNRDNPSFRKSKKHSNKTKSNLILPFLLLTIAEFQALDESNTYNREFVAASNKVVR